MEIIFGRQNAEMLRSKYTVLDLETVPVDPEKPKGETVEVFCLIPADKLNLGDLPQLEQFVKLHHDFLRGYKKGEYEYCLQCIGHLRGQFGGEVDSFYDEIERRINTAAAD